jgi:hypothetical protein
MRFTVAAPHRCGNGLGVYLNQAAAGAADIAEIPAGKMFYKAEAAAYSAWDETFFLGGRRSGPGFNQPEA